MSFLMADFQTVMNRLAIATGSTSDAELARLLGLSTSDFAQRKGRNKIPLDRMISVASLRKVSVDWLLTGEGSPTRDSGRVEPAQSESLSREEAAVLALFRALDPDAQREIQTVAEEKKRLREVERQLRAVQAELAGRKKSA